MVNEQYYRQQYNALNPEARRIIDVLTFYLHPLEHHLIIDAVRQLTALQDKDIAVLVKELVAKGLVIKQLTGTYALPPALSFLLFPEIISNPDYTFLSHLTRGVNPLFFQVNIKAQELQQLLTAYFTGSRSLLLLPVKKLEQELNEYLPAVSYLLYFPRYTELLRFFSQESMDRLLTYALNLQIAALAPLDNLAAFAAAHEFSFPLIPLLQGNITGPAEGFPFRQAVVAMYDKKNTEAQSLFNKGLKIQRQHDKKNTLPASPVWAFYYTYLLTQLSASLPPY